MTIASRRGRCEGCGRYCELRNCDAGPPPGGAGLWLCEDCHDESLRDPADIQPLGHCGWCDDLIDRERPEAVRARGGAL